MSDPLVVPANPFHDDEHHHSPSAPPANLRPLSTDSAWSFFATPTPDLSFTLPVDEPSSVRDEAGKQGGAEGRHGTSFSLQAETIPPTPLRQEEQEDETSSAGSGDEGRSGEEQHESPWTTPEVEQGAFPPSANNSLESTTKSSSGLLAAPSPLNRSAGSYGSAPDSFVDPYMAAPATAQPPIPSPSFSSHSFPLPLVSSIHGSTPPRSPSTPSSSSLFPPPTFPVQSTPSPPRFDLSGRPLPSAPPGLDPFAFALSQGVQPPSSPRSAKGRLGSLRSLTLPFHRNHGGEEDLTSSSFASIRTGTSGTGGGGQGYWDTSLDISGVLPTQTSTPPRPPQTAPSPSPSKRPGPSPLTFLTRSQTSPADLLPLSSPSLSLAGPPPPSPSLAAPKPAHTILSFPPSPSHVRPLPSLPLPPASSPSSPHIALSVSPLSPASSNLASRRSVQRPPSQLALPSSPPVLSSTSTSTNGNSAPTGSSPSALRPINRSPDGFYRPVPSPVPLPVPSPSSLSAPKSPYGTTHVLTGGRGGNSPELAFPLPPPTPSAVSSAGSGDPLNPFATATQQREGMAGSAVSARTGGSGWGKEGRKRESKVPSFVSVFTPPVSGVGTTKRDPFGDAYGGEGSEGDEEEEESLEAGEGRAKVVGIYPPREVGGGRHRAGVESLSSSVAFGLGGVDSPRRVGTGAGAEGVRNRFPSAVPEEKTREKPEKDDEKHRRTAAWLAGVSPEPSSPSTPFSEKDNGGGSASSPTTAASGVSGVKWATPGASTVGWSIRSEREQLAMQAAAKGGGGKAASTLSSSRRSSRRRKYAKGGGGVRGWWARRSKRVRIALLVGLVVVLLLLVGLAVGLGKVTSSTAVVAAACRCENGGSPTTTAEGVCECSCREGWGGTSCAFNSTCVSGLAAGLLDVAASANGMWQPQIDTTRLATVLGRYVFPSSPSPIDGSTSLCTSHLTLLTLPNLPSSSYPSRLRWSESALLHTLALTESNSSLTSLRTFASALEFEKYGDEASGKSNSNYQTIVGGYTWDFSTLSRSVQDVGWSSSLSPTEDASDAVEAAGEDVQAALNMVTNAAMAASKQRTTALKHYWNDTLSLSSSQLDAFRSVVQAAEVVIPFDASATFGGEGEGGTSVVNLAVRAKEAGGTFPPAVGCWSGLSGEQVERVNEVDGGVFGLESVSAGQTGNASCVNRPLYGTLNLLSLRLPFPSSDSRTSLPLQSLVLLSPSSSTSSSLSSRLTLHAGETLLAGASASSLDPSSSPSANTTIEEYGLFSEGVSGMDHVLLSYLSLMPSVEVAQALVAHVLSGSSSSPPNSTSTLYTASNKLADIPVLEVQFWGGLRYEDADFARSGLTTSPSSSELFFGSTAGGTFRSWALSTNTSSSSSKLARIDWAPSAESATVATDESAGGSSAFETVWSESGGTTARTASAVWTALRKAGVVE
ncbi:hypothetical protein JCM8547_002726 [Rhodosporidiobolus lusitaniae]